MEQASDSELMERYTRGDPRAFEELFRRYERRAHAFYLHRTHSPERASDLYQDLFLRLHRFRHRYDPSQPFAPWFFRMAQRVLYDDFRRMRGSPRVSLNPERQCSAETSTEQRVIARDEALGLLSLLSDEQARVLMASKVEGAAYSEIARDIGKSIDAVKQIGSRALRLLRRQLAETT